MKTRTISVQANIRTLWIVVVVLALLVAAVVAVLFIYVAGLQSAQDDLARQIFELSHR